MRAGGRASTPPPTSQTASQRGLRLRQERLEDPPEPATRGPCQLSASSELVWTPDSEWVSIPGLPGTVRACRQQLGMTSLLAPRTARDNPIGLTPPHHVTMLSPIRARCHPCITARARTVSQALHAKGNFGLMPGLVASSREGSTQGRSPNLSTGILSRAKFCYAD